MPTPGSQSTATLEDKADRLLLRHRPRIHTPNVGGGVDGGQCAPCSSLQGWAAWTGGGGWDGSSSDAAALHLLGIKQNWLPALGSSATAVNRLAQPATRNPHPTSTSQQKQLPLPARPQTRPVTSTARPAVVNGPQYIFSRPPPSPAFTRLVSFHALMSLTHIRRHFKDSSVSDTAD